MRYVYDQTRVPIFVTEHGLGTNADTLRLAALTGTVASAQSQPEPASSSSVTDPSAAAPARPRFSLVVPCFNEADFVGATLRSLRAQTYTGPYEIVVVDNNCTDATAEIAQGYGTRVVQESRPGVCWARQRGTNAARGEIVVSVDADTTYPPDWLAAIARNFDADEQAAAVVGPCRYVAGPAWGRLYGRLLFGAVHGWYRLTGRTVYVTATNIAFRRSMFDGYDVRLTQGGDELDVLRRLRQRGRIVYDHGNPAFTSSRRLTRGPVYGLVVSLFFYYLLGYGLNRGLRRTVIGSAPAFRADPSRRARRWRMSGLALLGGLGVAFVLARLS